jgi:hypothetical protein
MGERSAYRVLVGKPEGQNAACMGERRGAYRVLVGKPEGQNVACMGERRGAYRVLVGKPEGQNPLGRPRCSWEDNIKTNLQEVRYRGMDRIDLAQDRERWHTLVNAVMILCVP